MCVPQPIGEQPHIQLGVRLSKKLTRIIWLCMLPLFLFAATLAILQIREIHQDQIEKASLLAKNVVLYTDNAINSRIKALSMLATSSLVDDASKWHDLYREAQGFYRSFGEGAILNLAKVVLQRYGYNVLVAGRPNDALTLVQHYKQPIHLVITDVVMPEMNGSELKKALQKLIPEMKVLFMSGYTANIVADRGVLEKDVEFLQKPFSVESLASKVREVLDRA
jgi:CheY-like chemotaxis protein